MQWSKAESRKRNPRPGSTRLRRTIGPGRLCGDESTIAAIEQLKIEMKRIRYVHSGASFSHSETLLPVAEQLTGAMILE